MESVRIYGTIPVTLKTKLDEKLVGGEYKISDILTLALRQYLFPTTETTKIDSSNVVLEHVQESTSVFDESTGKGLIIPSGVPVIEGIRQVKEIKSAFSIQPGPGAYLKLKNIGINPQDVINARRAKRAGRDYNKELEKYFESI